MHKIERPVESLFGLERPVSRLLMAGAALVLVLLISPLTIPPLLERWVQPTPQPAVEEWPAAPATYVQPTVAPAVMRSPPTATPLPAPVWRELSYLTTVEFTISSVVEAQRTASVAWLGEMVTDRLLLKVVGEVQVGIDLSEVTNVQIKGDAIRFVAPAPIVTSVELLPDQSQIFSRQQMLFLSQYQGLETQALEQARQQLYYDVATNPSMMKLAQEFARLQLTEFLHKVGFATVEVMFQMQSYTDMDD